MTGRSPDLRAAGPSFEPFPLEATAQTIGQRFDSIVARYPERTAVIGDSGDCSYSELDRLANRARACLESTGSGADRVVAISLPQGARQIAAILGALKAGRPYVCVDPDLDESGQAGMYEHSRAAVLVADMPNTEAGSYWRSRGRTVIRPECLFAAVESPQVAPARGGPDDDAYLYFTSGTGGDPKAVRDSHRNVLHNIMRYTNSLRIGPDDRLTLLQSSSFSGAVSSLFAALLNGAAVRPFDTRRSSLAEIARCLGDDAITMYHSVPGLFRGVFSHLTDLPALRVVRLEGDRARRGDLDLFNRVGGPDSVLVNGLGTTETGLATQQFYTHGTTTDDAFLPIGQPVDGVRVDIVNDDRRPCRNGEVGQIVVSGRYVATGYWRDAERTRASFVDGLIEPGLRSYLTGDLGRVRKDGAIDYLGRMDRQWRYNGRTWLLADIDAALIASGLVRDAFSVPVTVRAQIERLVISYVPVRPGHCSVRALREALGRQFHVAGLPLRFVESPSLPKNRNGKVDTRTLPGSLTTRPLASASFVPAASRLEAGIVRLWEGQLGIDGIGVDDDFYALGGDSLGLATVMAAAEREFGELTGPVIDDERITVATMARAVGDPTAVTGAIRLRNGDSRPPLIWLHGDERHGGLYCRQLAQHLDPQLDAWALPPCPLRPGGEVRTYESMVDYHLQALRELQPNGPYILGGTCKGGLAALELALELRRQGENVQQLIVFAASAANVRYRKLSRRIAQLDARLRIGSRRADTLFLYSRRLAEHWRMNRGVRRWGVLLRKTAGVLRRQFLATVGRSTGEPPDPYRRADHLYVPGRYDGRIVVLWPTDEVETLQEATADWGAVSPHVSVRRIEATHRACLAERVDLLGAAINAACRTAAPVPTAETGCAPE